MTLRTGRLKKTGAVYKHHYDETARSSVLMPGDLVLVQKVGVKCKHKIGDKWEHDPYIVISQPNDDIPVYEVRWENSRAKKTRLLRRTLLLPFVGLPRLDEEDFEEDPDSLVVVWDDQQDQAISQIDPGDSAVRTNSEDFCCLRMMILQTWKRLWNWMAQVNVM